MKFSEERSRQEKIAFLKQQWKEETFLGRLDAETLEALVAVLFRAMGNATEEIGGPRDAGADVIVIEPNGTRALVQCKNWRKTVGVRVVRELIGAMGHHKVLKGYIFARSDFSPDARKLAAEWNIDLLDGKQLARLIEKYLPARIPASAQDLSARDSDETFPE
jgi:restriction system protein